MVCYLFFDIQCYWFFLCGHLWLWFVICCLLFDVIGFIAWPSVAVGSCRLRPSAAKSGGKQFVTEAIARKYDTEIARKIWHLNWQKNMTLKLPENMTLKLPEKYDIRIAWQIMTQELPETLWHKNCPKNYDTRIPWKMSHKKNRFSQMLQDKYDTIEKYDKNMFWKRTRKLPEKYDTRFAIQY